MSQNRNYRLQNKDWYKDGQTYPLNIGESFYNSDEELVTLKYDFKPPQGGPGQQKCIEVDDKKEVTVTVSDENSEDHVYKGSENDALRECLIIIDHETGEITLEKVSKKMQVKRTRKPGSSKNSMHMQDSSSSRNSIMSTPPVAGSMPTLDFGDDYLENMSESSSHQQQNNYQKPKTSQPISNDNMKSQFDSSSSSSSSSSDSSDSESESQSEQNTLRNQSQNSCNAISSIMLKDDLELSEDEE